MITKEKINECMFEAKRFLKRAEELKKRLDNDNMAKYGCKESGSLKRTSMDLSRSLVELRR